VVIDCNTLFTLLTYLLTYFAYKATLCFIKRVKGLHEWYPNIQVVLEKALRTGPGAVTCPDLFVDFGAI